MSEINLTIKCSNADKVEVKIEDNSTVFNLKEKIGAALNLTPQQQRLIYKGKVLKDESTLDFYKILDGHTVHMVKSGVATASQSAAAAQTASAPTQTAAPQTQTAAAPTPASSIPATNPTANPFNFPNMFDTNAFNQQLMNDPNMMSQIAQSPLFDSFLNNPEMIRDMMNSNPQIQALLEQNPQYREAFNDPEVIFI